MRVGVVFPGKGSQAVGLGDDVASAYRSAKSCLSAAKTIISYDMLTISEQGPEAPINEER